MPLFPSFPFIIVRVRKTRRMSNPFSNLPGYSSHGSRSASYASTLGYAIPKDPYGSVLSTTPRDQPSVQPMDTFVANELKAKVTPKTYKFVDDEGMPIRSVIVVTPEIHNFQLSTPLTGVSEVNFNLNNPFRASRLRIDQIIATNFPANTVYYIRSNIHNQPICMVGTGTNVAPQTQIRLKNRIENQQAATFWLEYPVNTRQTGTQGFLDIFASLLP